MNITKEALKQMIAEEMSRLKENNPFERPAGTFAPEKSPEEKAASECRSLRQRVRMAINDSTMPLRVRIDRKLKDQMMASPSCFEKSEFERLVGKVPEGALDELPSELQEAEKKMIAEEMANAGVVNEEDKCAKIRAKEEELFLISKDLEVKGYGFESYQTLQNARELRQANKECFPEYFKDKAPEPGKSGMDITKKQYGLKEAEDYELDEGFTYDTMTPEEKKKGIEREERMIAAEEERLKKSLASAKSDAQRALAQKIYKRNKEQSEKIIARLKGEVVPAKPDPDAINPDFDRDYDEYSRVYQESKKDLLKRIVAEELAKMEIEQLGKEGSLEEIFGLFGDRKEV